MLRIYAQGKRQTCNKAEGVLKANDADGTLCGSDHVPIVISMRLPGY